MAKSFLNFKRSTQLTRSVSCAIRDFNIPMVGIIEMEILNLEPVPRNAKENIVHLFLVNTMNKLRVDELTFFRIAHVWSFGTDPDLTQDAINYKLHAIIPKYVEKYVQSLQ